MCVCVTTRQNGTPRCLYNSFYKYTSDQDNNPNQVKAITYHFTSTVEISTTTVENYFLACSTQKDAINDKIIPSDDPT